MLYPKIPLAQSIIEICLAKGIEHVVISPGSRNAPLTIGFANIPAFTCYSIADERCAGFFALGIAQQIKKPVVLVCTSGSAVLNYFPAVAEAYYSQIPLVVISADRPKEKIDIGDGQTIQQEAVFGTHSLYNANLTEEASEENDIEINEAFNKAFTKKGPTHINVPFEEPLYETVSKPEVDTIITTFSKIYKTIPLPDIIAATNIWNTSRKKLVLVGTNEPGSIEKELLNKLAKDPSVVIMTECTSNLHHPAIVQHIDRIITPFTPEDFEALSPDVLLTFGGMIVSKRIKAFLRNYPPFNHWHIDRHRAYDTFNALTHHFEAHPNEFFNQFLPYTKKIESDYQEQFTIIKEARKVKHENYVSRLPFSDFKAFDMLLKKIPHHCMLQIGNSAPIRYAQLIELHSSIEVFCNRGTSGIDGSTTTAVGAAVGAQKDTVMVTGDVSFLYDSNALWNQYIPENFKIIVMNNGGGGIFRILPGHQDNSVFTTFFETSHCLTAEHLAKMYHFDYQSAHDEVSLKKILPEFFKNTQKPKILEIFTPTAQNDVVLKQYFSSLV